MINWEKLKENSSLEDFYNILCRKKPHRNSQIYKEWDYLEIIVYEELLEENERPKECEYLIDKIIEFLINQRQSKDL